MSNIENLKINTKEEISKLIYKNSIDTGDGVLIDHKEIYNLIDKIDDLFSLPVVVDTLVCDCEISKPKSPFMDDEGYDYCRDCDGHITN
jgi:hypothetical protein